MRQIMLIISFTLLTATACSGNSNQNKESSTVTNTTTNVNKGKPIELTKADFLAKVANYEASPEEWKYLGDKPAIIDYYATWCGPCKAIAPILNELAEEYADEIYIYKIDVDKEQELAALFGVRSIPTLLFIPVGGMPQIAQGALPKATFKEVIDTVLLPKK